MLTSTLKGDTWTTSQILLDFGDVLFILSWKTDHIDLKALVSNMK